LEAALDRVKRAIYGNGRSRKSGHQSACALQGTHIHTCGSVSTCRGWVSGNRTYGIVTVDCAPFVLCTEPFLYDLLSADSTRQPSEYLIVGSVLSSTFVVTSPLSWSAA
jgi:hypothetical protein